MTFAVIGGQQRRRRTYPQHRHGNMKSRSGEIDAQLPKGKHHEQHNQIDEQVNADQQTRQDEDDEHRPCGDACGILRPVFLLMALMASSVSFSSCS